MSQYLYGAEVQGIQNFILESSKLREIAGGSEFVEQICTSKFQTIFNYKPNNLIQGAAGIIRYLFEEDEKSELEKVVKGFPYEIQKQAPGITISQAVVKIEGELTPDHISDLILKLDAQRNNPQLSFLAAPMIAERSRTNGQTAISKDHSDYLSQQQKLKRDIIGSSDTLAIKLDLNKESLPSGDLDEISGSGKNKDQWLAVIHADGNSLGKLILKANTELIKNKGDVKAFYSLFSKNLNDATIKAARGATLAVLSTEISSKEKGGDDKIPIRPVVLGGDDFTVIIKGKYALRFAHKFIELFENETKTLVYEAVLKNYGDFHEFSEGLTTCAGIAYIKPNYPFHYAADLAEQLCKAAKSKSKAINQDCAPSSLMFHQVHSSFIGEWEEIVKRELTVPAGSFVGGPYFFKQQNSKTISKLQTWTDAISQKDSIKSQIRSLITEYIDNPGGAQQYEKRLRKNSEKKFGRIGLDGDSIFDKATKISHAWDIIKLSTIQQD